MSNSTGHKQALITALGGSQIQSVVLDLYNKSLPVYLKRGDNAFDYRVSVNENDYSTSGIVLIVLALESIANRIYYIFQKENIVCKANLKDPSNKLIRAISHNLNTYQQERALINIFNKDFDFDFLEEMLKEIFALRNAIMHGFIFEMEFNLNDDYSLKSYKEKELVIGQVKDSFNNRVIYRKRAPSHTKILNLKVLPTLVGFEEIHLSLAIFNLYINIVQTVLGYKYAPIQIYHETEDGKYLTLGELLAQNSQIIHRAGFRSRYQKLLIKIQKKYSYYYNSVIG
ncbi:MAG: hypothetical protein ACO1RX_14450 [Candidatus Sericytochromatia bacterium]